MKKIQLLILLLFLQHFSFSQSACDNKVKVEQLQKQEGGKNYGDRYNALERARFYWWRRCQCESGQVSDPAGEQTIIKYLATGYDNFLPYKGKFDDIPEPNKRDFKTGDCYTSSEPNISITYGLDCTPEANSFLQSAKDPQQYGKAFFAAYCECNTGAVSSEQRAKQLEATMLENYKNYNTYKASGEPSISVQPLNANQCLANNSYEVGSNNNDKFSLYKNELINSDFRSFISDLAQNSDNQNLIQLSKDLDEIEKINAETNQLKAMWGIQNSQSDLDLQNLTKNIAQGVKVLKFLANSLKSKPVELTNSQIMAKNAMKSLRDNLVTIYNQVNTLPSFTHYNQETLNKLEEYQKKLYQYSVATAAERRVVIKYFWNEKYYSFEEIDNIYSSYKTTDPITLIEQIDNWESYANFEHAVYLANADKAFKVTKYIIALIKSQCYKSMNQIEKAEAVINNLDFKLTIDETLLIVKNAIENNQLETLNSFYPILKQFVIEHPNAFKNVYEIKKYGRENKQNSEPALNTIGSIVPGISDSNESISVYFYQRDINLYLGAGIYAYIKDRQLETAQKEIDFLNRYLELQEISDEEKNNFKIMLLGLEAEILMQEGKNEEALAKTEIAINNLTSKLGFYNWLYFIKYKILTAENDIDQANKVYNLINSNYSDVINDSYFLFNIIDLKFEKCLFLFKNDEYERALNGLTIIESVGKNDKYTLLKYEIYKKLGYSNKAEIELKKMK